MISFEGLLLCFLVVVKDVKFGWTIRMRFIEVRKTKLRMTIAGIKPPD
jgi:hypothetical protein